MMINILRQLKRAAWSFLARGMGLRYRLPSGSVVQVESYSDWCTIGDIFINGEYDTAIDFALLSFDRKLDFVFLDLGANVGLFTQRLLHKAHWKDISMASFKGLLVEATPSQKPQLERRLSELTQMGADLRIVIAAAGKRSGVANMNEGRSHSRNSTTIMPTRKGWCIPFIDLESESLTSGVVDLIKCDIEGAEKDFLLEYGNLLQRCKVFVIECHPPVCDEIMARSRVESLGLEFRGVLRSDKEGTTIWFSNPRNT